MVNAASVVRTKCKDNPFAQLGHLQVFYVSDSKEIGYITRQYKESYPIRCYRLDVLKVFIIITF